MEMDPFLQFPWSTTVSCCITFCTLMSARQSHNKVLKKKKGKYKCKILRVNTSKAFHVYCIAPVIPCHYYHYFLLQRKWCGVNKHNPFDTCLWPRCFCSSALKWIKLWQMLLIPCFIVVSSWLGCTHWESLSFLHVFLKCCLVLREPNIARAINHNPNIRCWEKYPGAFQGRCGPAAGFCY